ncbi:MAG: alpha/beta hydrolase [Oscillospiraceae bacterium]|nr:alpha/beta hydrolase [Oscillospiraceae bacterium]
MVSVMGLAMREQLKLLKPLISNASIESQRKGQDLAGELGLRAAGSKIEVVEEPFENFKAAFVTPNEMPDSRRVLLYLHGGAYVAGGLEYSLGFGSILALNTGIKTLCVGYRLAPEHVFPAAIDDALAAYERLLESYDAQNISLVGESAGGGLLLALMYRLKDENKPLPRSAVALSPWTDLTLSGESYTANEEIDPTLSKESLRFDARLYAADELKDPYVSPLFGLPTGFPKTLIYVGECEMLLDDSRRMAELLLRAGCDCELHIAEGMWHVYVLFGMPESREALERISEFLKDE